MSKVVIENLVKSYDGRLAVDGVSFELADGELFSLLGSSGCGKTTTMRCLAGLEKPDSGRILIDGCDMAGVPVSERGCGMVFQNYALFPHLTVAENVAYGLAAEHYRKKGMLGRLPVLLGTLSAFMTRADDERVKEALAAAELESFADYLPGRLSGGQQQRTALARALITRPRLLLCDEPLGALDAKLRVKMREEIRRIQRRAGITTLYVTHDQEEALAVSDRIALMDKGRIVQIGTAEDIYTHPRSRFAAEFIGLDNIFTLPDGGAREEEGLVSFRLSEDCALRLSKEKLGKSCIAAAVRPEAVKLSAAGEHTDSELKNESGLQGRGKIIERIFMGASVKYVLDSGGLRISVRVPLSEDGKAGLRPGIEVLVTAAPSDIVMLEES